MQGNEASAEQRQWLCTLCLAGARPDGVLGKRFWSYWKLDKTWYPGTILSYFPKFSKFYLAYVAWWWLIRCFLGLLASLRVP